MLFHAEQWSKRFCSGGPILGGEIFKVVPDSLHLRLDLFLMISKKQKDGATMLLKFNQSLKKMRHSKRLLPL